MSDLLHVVTQPSSSWTAGFTSFLLVRTAESLPELWPFRGSWTTGYAEPLSFGDHIFVLVAQASRRKSSRGQAHSVTRPRKDCEERSLKGHCFASLGPRAVCRVLPVGSPERRTDCADLTFSEATVLPVSDFGQCVVRFRSAVRCGNALMSVSHRLRVFTSFCQLSFRQTLLLDFGSARRLSLCPVDKGCFLFLRLVLSPFPAGLLPGCDAVVTDRLRGSSRVTRAFLSQFALRAHLRKNRQPLISYQVSLTPYCFFCCFGTSDGTGYSSSSTCSPRSSLHRITPSPSLPSSMLATTSVYSKRL